MSILIAKHSDDGVFLASWLGLSEGETGRSVACQFPDRCAQITGDFGGGTCHLEGSVDGTNWVALSDLDGDPISVTAAALVGIRENTPWLRARVEGGDGAAVSVFLSALTR